MRMFALASVLVACTTTAAPQAPVDPAVLRSGLYPLPARFESTAHPSSEALIALGRMLYYEPRLSKNYDHSCNSCHALANGGVDHARVSTGHRGQLGRRNAPTVFNAAGQREQFWDGRAVDVEEQALGPILNPIEMAMPDEAHVVAVLASIPGYVDAFADAFPGDPQPITLAHVGEAIGAFERGLVTPSRWDAYLRGDDGALTDDEQRGGMAFVTSGCRECHDQTLLGGMSMHRFAVPGVTPTDLGRYEITHERSDMLSFKVPSLRNVAETAPYFNDGSVADLHEAIRTMGQAELGRALDDATIDRIVVFLRALDAPPDPSYVAPPALPASGPDTPPPDPS